jgi:hypothetical protein
VFAQVNPIFSLATCPSSSFHKPEKGWHLRGLVVVAVMVAISLRGYFNPRLPLSWLRDIR